jgi:TolB-like protein
MPINLFNKSVTIFVIFLTGFLGLGAKGGHPSGETIAVFPVYNISGQPAPIKEIREAFTKSLKAKGLNVLENDIVDSTLAKHRIRYLGGVDSETARSFKEDTGAEAILIMSLELFSDRTPPKLALISRLVSTEENPVLQWMDDAGVSGDDSPGLLGLSRIDDSHELILKTIESLSSSLTEVLNNGRNGTDAAENKKKFQPKQFYRSPVLATNKNYRVAVLPFYNRSDRKYAGEILSLNFTRWLMTRKNFFVIEPGSAYSESLQSRLIMDDGLSLTNADLLFKNLDVDLIVTGNVMDYQDDLTSSVAERGVSELEGESAPLNHGSGAASKTKVDFSVQIIERNSREVVWSSRSYNQGDDGVFFFGIGKQNTAHALASQMVQDVVNMMLQ